MDRLLCGLQVVESKATDLGGIKAATALVSGRGVFGQLRWECGVHRATMVPPNDKAGRMQTGTAVVIAMPEASEVRLVLRRGVVGCVPLRSLVASCMVWAGWFSG